MACLAPQSRCRPTRSLPAGMLDPSTVTTTAPGPTHSLRKETVSPLRACFLVLAFLAAGAADAQVSRKPKITVGKETTHVTGPFD